jgi:hypothetical protein
VGPAVGLSVDDGTNQTPEGSMAIRLNRFGVYVVPKASVERTIGTTNLALSVDPNPPANNPHHLFLASFAQVGMNCMRFLIRCSFGLIDETQMMCPIPLRLICTAKKSTLTLPSNSLITSRQTHSLRTAFVRALAVTERTNVQPIRLLSIKYINKTHSV